jgi:large subunit ribosomal protein L3
MDTLYGHKVGMTQVFTESGALAPVTVIQAGPCYVTQVRTVPRDGYDAVQLGLDPARRLTKAEAGHLTKAGAPLLRTLREVRGSSEGYEVGQEVTVALFARGDLVDVSGTSKGKGFQGGVKRHHFRGGPKTHGQSDRHRAPGSIGSGTTPGRVYKGTRMAGHMGDRKATVQCLRVVDIDVENNLLLIKGAIPGAKNGLVAVRKTVKTGKLKEEL